MNTPHSVSPRESFLDGRRILILSGKHIGEEGICLGKSSAANRWAVSPDSSTAILDLKFESEFALVLNLSAPPMTN